MITFNEWKVEKIAAAAGLDIGKYDKKQLDMGMKEELEHGKKNKNLNVTDDDPSMTLKIVLAHLKEDPEYYTKLKKTF